MEERIKIENEWYIKESAIHKYVKTESAEIKESDIFTTMSRLYEDSDLWIDVVIDPKDLAFLFCTYKDKKDGSAKEQKIENGNYVKNFIKSNTDIIDARDLGVSIYTARKLKNIFAFLSKNKYVIF